MWPKTSAPRSLARSSAPRTLAPSRPSVCARTRTGFCVCAYVCMQASVRVCACGRPFLCMCVHACVSACVRMRATFVVLFVPACVRCVCATVHASRICVCMCVHACDEDRVLNARASAPRLVASSSEHLDEAGVESKTPLGAREEDEERRGEVIGASIRNDTTTMARDGYTGQR
jgi:hypothetical protein